MQDLFSGLPGATFWSSQQEAIFDWFKAEKGNLVVRARAGTGKTTTIIQAIVHAPEEKILLAAFNKRIQEELNAKLRNRRASAKTLHALGFMFLKKRWPETEVDSTGERANNLVRKAIYEMLPTLFPDMAAAPIDQIEFNEAVIRHCAKILTTARDIAPFARTENDVLDVIYEQDQLPEPYLEQQGWTVPVMARIVLRAMEIALHKTKYIDFADMVYIPLRNDWIKGMYDLVCVDEAQDMNKGQLELAIRVCKEGGRIAIIGDDKQAIYGFRGADSNGLDRLKAQLNAKELGLTITYRCPQTIVEYAAQLVPDIQARPGAPEGSITSIRAEELHTLVKPGDFVLSRSNAPLTKACLTLIRKNVRAQIAGRDIGQRLANIARKLKATDVTGFYKKLGEWAKREIDRAKKADRKGRIQLVCDQADTLRALLFGINHIDMLYKRIDDMFGDPSAAMVQCSSVHRAKGLEANRVFILQDTLYPGNWGKNKNKEEEANIEYVAVTRSKDQLIWVNGFNPRKKFESTKSQAWDDERWNKAPWDEEDFGDDSSEPTQPPLS